MFILDDDEEFKTIPIVNNNNNNNNNNVNLVSNSNCHDDIENDNGNFFTKTLVTK